MEHQIASKQQQQQQEEKAMATAMPSNDTTPQPPKDKDSSTKKVNQWLHTYANATKTNPKQQKAKNQTTRDQRKSNTYTFFNLMTAENITDQIIRELVDHFKKPAKDLLSKVCRDTRFRSRYQVTFQNEDDLENLITNGITINGIRVRGASRGQAGELPVRFYIPNLPSYVNKDDVETLFETSPCYVKDRIHKEFGIPTGGFFVGFLGVQREDIFVEFEGQSYKVVCIDKPRIRLPAQNDSQEQAQLASDVPPKTSTPKPKPTEHIPAPLDFVKETSTTPPKETNDTEMETDFFKVTPDQQVFTFGNIQKDDPLALSEQEQGLLKELEEKTNLSQAELEKRIELTNRSYCTTPPGSESTKSGDTVKTTTSTFSTKRKKATTKTKHRKKK